MHYQTILLYLITALTVTPSFLVSANPTPGGSIAPIIGSQMEKSRTRHEEEAQKAALVTPQKWKETADRVQGLLHNNQRGYGNLLKGYKAEIAYSQKFAEEWVEHAAKKWKDHKLDGQTEQEVKAYVSRTFDKLQEQLKPFSDKFEEFAIQLPREVAAQEHLLTMTNAGFKAWSDEWQKKLEDNLEGAIGVMDEMKINIKQLKEEKKIKVPGFRDTIVSFFGKILPGSGGSGHNHGHVETKPNSDHDHDLPEARPRSGYVHPSKLL